MKAFPALLAATTILVAPAFAEPLELEKDELTFGFIKLTDMAPLAVAYENGYFLDEGLFVTLEAQANWKVLLDGVIDGTLDGAHMLAGQPLAATIGYSKGLRTVKTCVGTDHCRFGTQDSTGLGVKLEKALWGSWTPHRVKLAVSGCPRNCAEATCKDVGIVCVDSGYQVGVGGAAGMDLKETQRLADAKTEAEAIEITIAFVQLYRENARYLDRPYKWIAKVGLDWVKARVVEDHANRAALIERFRVSQSVYQKDPWAEHAEKERARYATIANLMLEAAE